ncbi:MAG: hypothetical protein ACXIVE_01010 [Salinarimonas sp.]
MIFRTLKAAVIIGLLTLAAGQYAYTTADRAALERLVSGEGPLVTGSVNGQGQAQTPQRGSGMTPFPDSATNVRLDPCNDQSQASR